MKKLFTAVSITRHRQTRATLSLSWKPPGVLGAGLNYSESRPPEPAHRGGARTGQHPVGPRAASPCRGAAERHVRTLGDGHWSGFGGNYTEPPMGEQRCFAWTDVH